MNYNDMPAGAEMDRLIAEKVMGWHARGFDGKWHDWYDGHDFVIGWSRWHPSACIFQAWQVVEHLAANKRKWLDLIQTDDGWMVGQGGRGYADSGGRVDLELIGAAEADTAPLAICRAALLAMGAGR